MSDQPIDTTALLGRLLGPAGAEVSCDECFDRLDAYVELDLAGADVRAALPGMEEHLEGCPACREDFESLRTVVGGGEGPAPAAA